MSPKSSTRLLLQTVARRPSKNRTTKNISDVSNITCENTGLFGVSTMLEAICFARFSCWKQKSMHRETVARQREKKDKVLWSVLQNRCQGKADGTVSGVILIRLTENSILMDEISDNIFREELNKLFLVKIQNRENCTWLSTTCRF